MKTIHIVLIIMLALSALSFSPAYKPELSHDTELFFLKSPAPQPVTLFSNKNFGGTAKALHNGVYRQAQLGIGNDALSSIKIAEGYAVVLYQNDTGSSGKTININNSVADLNTLGFNDITSMVYIFKIAASLYSECNFSGRSIHLPEDHGNGQVATTEFAFPNDMISSVKVAPGKMLRLFSDPNLKGKTIDVTSNVSCLSTLNFNDMTSSWLTTEPLAVVYDNCNFTGPGKQLGKGPYRVLENSLNNKISSVKLISPYYMVLYENIDFGTGAKVTITESNSCLPASINNKTSSLEIKKPIE